MRLAVVEPAPRTLVQIEAVGADFVYLGYALAILAGVLLMVQIATLVVLIGRR